MYISKLEPSITKDTRMKIHKIWHTNINVQQTDMDYLWKNKIENWKNKKISGNQRNEMMGTILCMKSEQSICLAHFLCTTILYFILPTLTQPKPNLSKINKLFKWTVITIQYFTPSALALHTILKKTCFFEALHLLIQSLNILRLLSIEYAYSILPSVWSIN